jgi:hypothetical protein
MPNTIEEAAPTLNASTDSREHSKDLDGLDRITRILVEETLLTLQQVERAKKIQSRLEERKSLPALVTELGWVSRGAVEVAMRKHRGELTVEEILVEKGVLNPSVLDQAVETVKSLPGKGLGRYLVESGTVSDRDYLIATSEKLAIPYVDAEASLVDPEVLKRVNL